MALKNTLYIRVSDDDKELLKRLIEEMNLDAQATVIRKLIRDEAERRQIRLPVSA
jgi:hypothetical protein